MEEAPLGTREAAEMAQRHKRTVVNWIRAGLLPAEKMPGRRGSYVIKRSDLEKFLKQRYTPQPYQPDRE